MLDGCTRYIALCSHDNELSQRWKLRDSFAEMS